MSPTWQAHGRWDIVLDARPPANDGVGSYEEMNCGRPE
jgi:hypothetical protein